MMGLCKVCCGNGTRIMSGGIMVCSECAGRGEVDYQMIAEIESLRAELRDLYAQVEADTVDRSKLVAEVGELKRRLHPVEVLLSTRTADSAVAQAGIDLVTKYESEIEDLKEQLEYQKKQCADQVYRGNSIGYIYDKMVCYKKQVGELADERDELKVRLEKMTEVMGHMTWKKDAK